MQTETERFPRVLAAFEEGVTRGLHTGLQIYVSVDGVPLLHTGFGNAAPGRPMTPQTLMPWRSAGKPLTALLLLTILDQPQQQLQLPLSHWLPESIGTDKSSLTLTDLLTHQSGFPLTDTGWPHSSWDDSVRTVLQTHCQLPRGTAAYHPQSSWFLLGEIIRRVVAQGQQTPPAFAAILQQRLLDPLGMLQSGCGITAPDSPEIVNRLPVLYERQHGQLQVSPAGAAPWLVTPSAGGNLRGPISELGRFYEMLLRSGRTAQGLVFAAEPVVQLMTRRHRVAMHDQTFQQVIDFGLGVICNSARYGAALVPYGFGSRCSDSAFGHGGAQCSIGFCDPERRLVVAWAANGFCGEGQHQRRNQLINDAVFDDLGL
ncbi:MAG TPA: serine hydrolase [Planctomycetaceae bacterium]|nr:serine hydrolase [Planctomycetaceae bacterium]